jgi:hypothetical protein
MYCKHCGKQIDDDSKFCVYCGGSMTSTLTTTHPLPKTETPITSVMLDNNKMELPVGAIISALLCFVNAAVLFYLGTLQTQLISPLLGFWNIFISFVYIAIGIGIQRSKIWGYNWGLGSALLNVVLFGYSYSQNNDNLILFLILIQIAIAILLLGSSAYFSSSSQDKAYFNNTVLQHQFDITTLTPNVDKLRLLIVAEKRKIFNKNTSEILSLIEDICKTKNDAIQLIFVYNKTYNADLIKELKKMSADYDRIKENLTTFIDIGIIEKKYPHERKI